MFAVVSVGTLNVYALVEEGAIVGFEVVDDIDAFEEEEQNEVGDSQHERLSPSVVNVHYGQNTDDYHYAHHYERLPKYSPEAFDNRSKSLSECLTRAHILASNTGQTECKYSQAYRIHQ